MKSYWKNSEAADLKESHVTCGTTWASIKKKYDSVIESNISNMSKFMGMQ